MFCVFFDDDTARVNKEWLYFSVVKKKSIFDIFFLKTTRLNEKEKRIFLMSEKEKQKDCCKKESNIKRKEFYLIIF